MNCIYLKQKINRNLECKKQNKIINIKECNNCKYKEYKKCTELSQNSANSVSENNLLHYKSAKQTNCHTSKKIRQKTSKLAKLERKRFSVFTDDLEHCIICKTKKDHLHEVFPGAYRQRSMKEHMILPLCTYHHTQIHKDIELSLYWKRSCQKEFEKSHTRDEFIKIFGKSYLK
mgnify:CR=1 FL=1